MEKKVIFSESQLSNSKFSEQTLTNDYISQINELSSIIQTFYDSSSKYILSMKNCIKEINTNILNNTTYTLDESSNKCISSMNIIFNYLDTSINQFYSKIDNYIEILNLNKNRKSSSSSKKPSIRQKYFKSVINDKEICFNFNKDTIYNNYHKNNNKFISKINSNKEEINKCIKCYSNDEKISKYPNENDIINNSNFIIDMKKIDQNFIKNILTLLNILNYEKTNNKNIQYQQNLGKIKENIISQLTNTLNNGTEKRIMHRRIKSFSINNYSNELINSNEIENNQFNNLIINSAEKHKNRRNIDINSFKKVKNRTEINKKAVDYFEDFGRVKHNSDNNLDFFQMEKKNVISMEIEKLQKEVNLLEKNKKDLLIQIADLITKNNSLSEEVSILKTSNLKKSKFEKENNKLNKIIEELHSKINLIMDSKKELEKKNILFKESINCLENEKSNQLKEKERIKNNIEELKKENLKIIKIKNDIENENKLNKKEIRDLNIQISQLKKENEIINNIINDTNNKKDEYKEKYKKISKELEEEKEMNNFFEKKIKNLEKKLEENNINEYEDTKIKTFKKNYMNKVNEIEVEKLSRKYASPNNYRKNTSLLSTNNTSNKKIGIKNNIEEFEISPENYIIIKSFQLNNNLKWYLLKRIKKQNTDQIGTTMSPSPSQSSLNHLYRRYKYLKTNSKLNNERVDDSFSDYIWKANRNEQDFINFNNIDNLDNYNKNELSITKEKQKKINELELCIKNLEEKLEKKENDCNRINLNYAKLFKRTKIPDENYDKLFENVEKLKKENKILKKKIENFKSTQNFIGLSFIEDDLEGSRFIDDKCFDDILDQLVGNKNKRNTHTTTRYKKFENNSEINMLNFFKSHGDDNNREINDENNDDNKENIKEEINDNKENIKEEINDNKETIKEEINDNKETIKEEINDNKENIKEENNDDNRKEIRRIEYKRHYPYKIEETTKYDNKNNKNIIKNNYDKNINENQNKISQKNTDKKDEKLEEKNENKIEKKVDRIRSYNRKTENKKYLFNRYSTKRQSTNNKNDKSEENIINVNKDENENKDKEDKGKDKNEIKNLKSNNYYRFKRKNENLDEKNEVFKDINNKSKEKNKKINFINKNDNGNIEKKKENKLYDDKKIMANIKEENENENENITNTIYSKGRRIRKSYKRNQIPNNEAVDDNKTNNIENKKIEIIPNKIDEKNEEKWHYKSLKTMKIENGNKSERNLGLLENSSQSNRICRGRRFYKKKQEDLKAEAKEN